MILKASKIYLFQSTKYCAVFGCYPSKEEVLKQYSFPKNKKLAKQWAALCYRKDHINVQNAVICERHFSINQEKRNLMYELCDQQPPKNYRKLKKDAIPDQNLPMAKKTFNPSELYFYSYGLIMMTYNSFFLIHIL